jgi:hypothetical protein
LKPNLVPQEVEEDKNVQILTDVITDPVAPPSYPNP